MNVPKINSSERKNYNYNYNPVKISGYAAMVTGAASVVQASRHKLKSHKFLGVCTAVLALLHVGFIEYFHYKK